MMMMMIIEANHPYDEYAGEIAQGPPFEAGVCTFCVDAVVILQARNRLHHAECSRAGLDSNKTGDVAAAANDTSGNNPL